MSAVDGRTLVLDESLDHRLVPELAARGRAAMSVAELNLRGAADAELIDALGRRVAGWVLVTADDAVARDHRGVLQGLDGALAIVAADDEILRSRREIVHRWAHAMQAQDAGSTRRYGPARQAAWRRAALA